MRRNFPGHSAVYARNLMLQRHGYPLWTPEPYAANGCKHRAEGVHIGDVGYVTDEGAFEALFNLHAPSDHPANSRGVPSKFAQLHLGPTDIATIDNYHRPGQPVSSGHIKGIGVGISADTGTGSLGGGFECVWTSQEGGILHLPEGASRINALPKELFRESAIEGAINWYQFANDELSRGISTKSLRLITRVDKAQSWMVGSFWNTSKGYQTHLKVDLSEAGVEAYCYNWNTPLSTNVCYRGGPSNSLTDSSRGQSQTDTLGSWNQTMFLRGFLIELKRTFFRRRRTNVQVHDSMSPPNTIFIRRLVLSHPELDDDDYEAGEDDDNCVGDDDREDDGDDFSLYHDSDNEQDVLDEGPYLEDYGDSENSEGEDAYEEYSNANIDEPDFTVRSVNDSSVLIGMSLHQDQHDGVVGASTEPGTLEYDFEPATWLQNWVSSKVPDAHIVLIHDDDWCAALLEGDTTSLDEATFTQRLPDLFGVQRQYTVYDGQVVMCAYPVLIDIDGWAKDLFSMSSTSSVQDRLKLYLSRLQVAIDLPKSRLD
ncbi:hypothetical protein AX16_004596 [Volvariella volvacea WC 439]|nr:hypothetical protein AX16_004596 [Volvariella volvacea WC 439]